MHNGTDKVSINRIIETTGNYSMFKRLKGNRDVLPTRVNKIKSSILKVGYVTSPIIVNENFEIIDGQGRAEALKQLGRPIDYIVVPGAGINECISLNTDTTKWGLKNFINSYAENGNENYIRLTKLIKAYPKLSLRIIECAAFGVSITGDIYKKEKLVFDEDAYNNSIKVLEYFKKFEPYISKRKSFRKLYFYSALNFAYHHNDIDNNKLFEKFVDQYSLICSPANTKQGLTVLEDLYNGARTRKKVYLVTDYEKALENKYSWYNKKYME